MTSAVDYDIITHPAFVATKLEQYDDLVADYAEANRDVVIAKAEISALKKCIDIRESEILVNGGTDALTISGSNAETRKAQLKQACETDPTWKEYVTKLAGLELTLARREVAMESAQHQMRGCIRALDAAIAHVSWLAAIESRTSAERKWEQNGH